MNDDIVPAPEDRLSSLLIAYDEALAARGPLPSTIHLNHPPELQQRLEQGLACVRLLRELLPRPPAPEPREAAQGEPVSVGSLPQSQFGRFRIRRELGRGGFGIVFLADDLTLGRPVALKIPLPNVLLDPTLRERFLREARAAAVLDHPNLVPVYEAGEEGPLCYIASGYCPGPNLAVWLKRQQGISMQMAAHLVAEIADAVAHAHGRGILHRDLKPSNILLVPREANDPRPVSLDLGFAPRLTDFGLAKFLDEAGTETSTGLLLGTPHYMSPEQASGSKTAIGIATDVYALGVILYELLTGRTPFDEANLLLLLEQVRAQEPTPPQKIRSDVPDDLATICLKCLHKNPGQRFASATALAEDLRRYLRKEPIQARPLNLLSRAWSWCQAPGRVRDAGMMAYVIGIISVVNMALGLLAISTGALDTQQSVLLGQHVAITLLILGGPAVWVGSRILAGKGSALWIGMLLAPIYTGYMALLTGIGSLTLDEMIHPRDQLSQWGLASLAFFLLGVQFVTTALGLCAWYGQRRVVQSGSVPRN